MKLSDVTEKTPLIKEFINRLAKATKQAIPIVNVLKVVRVSGASAKPIEAVLENGQKVKLYVRTEGSDDDKLDIFRIDINGKQQPLSGDFDNSYKPSFNASVDALGHSIVRGQNAFNKKQAKVRVKPLRASAPKNKAQQRNELLQQVRELDKIITTKEAEKKQLEEKLAQALEQAAA